MIAKMMKTGTALKRVLYSEVCAPLIGKRGHVTPNTQDLDAKFNPNNPISPNYALGSLEFEQVVTQMLLEARKRGTFMAFPKESRIFGEHQRKSKHYMDEMVRIGFVVKETAEGREVYSPTSKTCERFYRDTSNPFNMSEAI